MKFLVSIVLTFCLFIFPIAALADSLSIDFEDYQLGSVNSQMGWSSFGNYDQEVVTNTYGIASFGNQSFRISDARVSGSFGDQTFTKSLANEAGESDALNGGFSSGTRQSHFEAQWDIATTSPNVQPGSHTTFSADRGDGARMTYLRFEDQEDGVHVFFDDVQGTADSDPITPGTQANFVETEISTISRDAHTIKMVVGFIPGPSNDVVKIYIDGSLVHSGTTWENYYRVDPESDPTQVHKSRTVDSLLIREAGTADLANLGGGFVIDNIKLLSSNAPTDMDQCKNGGWQTYPAFRNQGQCVSGVVSSSPNH